MKDYEHHVLDVPRHNQTKEKVSLCGLPLYMTWHFQDVGHAFLTRQQKQRLMICPDCLKVIREVFEEKEQGI